MKKISRREIVVFNDSSVNKLITFPEVGLVNIVDGMVVYQSPKERVDDKQVLVYRDMNQENKINISIKEGHYDVASALAKEARFYPKKELTAYISEAYGWINEGSIENQLAIISNRIKKRKPERYTVLNEVSVELNEVDRIYIYPNYPEFDLNIPVNWAYQDSPFDKRSWRYGLNAWVFMDSLLKSGSQEKLIYAKELALDWIKFNILEDNPNEFAWYDMGVAFRATRLPFIIDRCIRYDLLVPEEFALLSYALTLHVLDLTSLDKFASHSNHGLYQLCGLFAISKILPETKNSHLLSAYAEQQMLEMLERDVSEEGMHKEHSPDYHVYISDIVFAAINAGWITNSRIIDIANKMNDVNVFLLHPTTHAVRFGDTSERDFRSLLNKTFLNYFMFTVMVKRE